MTSREGDTYEVLDIDHDMFYQFVYSCIWKSVGNIHTRTYTNPLYIHIPVSEVVCSFNKLILDLLYSRRL